MSEDFLPKLFEHNAWANRQIIEACLGLSDEQLDAEPQSATEGTIRHVLMHMVASEQGYLSTLTGTNYRSNWKTAPPLAEMKEASAQSGEALVALMRGEPGNSIETRLQTRDGYYVESWVVVLQAVNHATEHREQIKSMLTALGVTPPDIDGWSYAEVTGALVPMATSTEQK